MFFLGYRPAAAGPSSLLLGLLTFVLGHVFFIDSYLSLFSLPLALHDDTIINETEYKAIYRNELKRP